MTRQAFAAKLSEWLGRKKKLTWAAVDKFESGQSASTEMMLAYPVLLGLSMDEMERVGRQDGR